MEDGYDVVCCTQWPNETQSVVSFALGIPANRYFLEQLLKFKDYHTELTIVIRRLMTWKAANNVSYKLKYR